MFITSACALWHSIIFNYLGLLVMSQKDFMIGPMDGIGDSEGEILGDKWRVNCLNMWKATLSERLTFENAIAGHLVVLIHELTHTCTDENHKDSWDVFICKSILNKNKKDVWA
jgi:hypothetical protein